MVLPQLFAALCAAKKMIIDNRPLAEKGGGWTRIPRNQSCAAQPWSGSNTCFGSSKKMLCATSNSEFSDMTRASHHVVCSSFFFRFIVFSTVFSPAADAASTPRAMLHRRRRKQAFTQGKKHFLAFPCQLCTHVSCRNYTHLRCVRSRTVSHCVCTRGGLFCFFSRFFASNPPSLSLTAVRP